MGHDSAEVKLSTARWRDRHEAGGPTGSGDSQLGRPQRWPRAREDGRPKGCRWGALRCSAFPEVREPSRAFKKGDDTVRFPFGKVNSGSF